MSRRELRERIFKLLFRVEFNSMEDMPEQEQLFFEEESPAKEEDAAYISDKYYKIKENLSEIDALLNEKAKGWDTSRMSKVDLTILRLAVYEIRYDESVPTGVAINEAVELAKKYGQDASSGFVNGILAKFA
jgi:N utilization substance protein B